MTETQTDAVQLKNAYSFCRRVAQREAKNFYYSFRILPQRKRDGICAIYAFMRQADDLSDNETLSLEQRREAMTAWLDRWRASRSALPNAAANPVFLAVADTQRRFGIPDELLEELVRGTTLDLYPGDPVTVSEASTSGAAIPVGEGLQGYQSFEDLYRYCYLVASVVGLVCIRIFGYSNPEAEQLAERTGAAFQLTNILRDVKEDAERGRIYLPQELLAEFQVRNEDMIALSQGRALAPNERAMLSALSVQASEYYGSGWKLLPMVDRDSRAALWVLIAIYNRLLQKIEARRGDVFSERIRVGTGEKLWMMTRGAVKVFWWRKGRRD